MVKYSINFVDVLQDFMFRGVVCIFNIRIYLYVHLIQACFTAKLLFHVFLLITIIKLLHILLGLNVNHCQLCLSQILVVVQ